jgi:hypothetical protein
MLKRLLHVHWFTRSWSSFGYDYKRCRCGERRAHYKLKEGYTPLAQWWLDGHDSPPPVAPPQGGSGSAPRPRLTRVPGPGALKHV